MAKKKVETKKKRLLTKQQEKFAREFFKHGDKVKAREKAGYSMKLNAESQKKSAENIYKNPNILKMIKGLEDGTWVDETYYENSGAPTKYSEEILEQVYNYSLLGATDVELAKLLNVSERTIYNWSKRHPEFLQAVNDGKEIADAKVASCLFKRATGYVITETREEETQGVIEKRVTTKKELAPDAHSMMFWLKNRQSKNWRDKKEIDETSHVTGTLETFKHTPESFKAAQEKLKENYDGLD